jgi:predicted SnoaL-like aldol condensation-catalyzing enzyme
MRKLSWGFLFLLILTIAACEKDSDNTPDPVDEQLTNEEKATELLISLETGDTSKAMKYIDPDQFIQHNHQMEDGRQSFVDAMLNGAFANTQVEIIRTLSDENLVALHSEYTISGEKKIAFDVFRFENGLIVEHWDNFQANQPENTSGRRMTDGPNTVSDLDKTEINRSIVNDFITQVMIEGDYPLTAEFLPEDGNLIQHNPMMADSLSGFLAAMDSLTAQQFTLQFETRHQTIAMGNFVLTLSEGLYGQPAQAAAFYDLFRLENDKIVEHWDVIETIPAQEVWSNPNGKF